MLICIDLTAAAVYHIYRGSHIPENKAKNYNPTRKQNRSKFCTNESDTKYLSPSKLKKKPYSQEPNLWAKSVSSKLIFL